MTAKRPNRTTIVIAPEIRDSLKHIVRKDQSYNQLLADLIKLYSDYIEKRFGGRVVTSQTQMQNAENTQPITSPSHHNQDRQIV
jgi:hypothetical protein